MEKRNCKLCSKEFTKPRTCSKRSWQDHYRYCSKLCADTSRRGKPTWSKGKKGLWTAWNKGKELHYDVWNKGKVGSDYAKAHGYGKWMLGKKQSVETRRKKSVAAKRVIAEGRHNFYIDGRTPKNKTIRHSLEYKLWRTAVFERDDYTCIWCGLRSGNGKKVILNADHIKPFAYFPELRFNLNNGRTLCIDCHKTTDTYKGKAMKQYQNQN